MPNPSIAKAVASYAGSTNIWEDLCCSARLVTLRRRRMVTSGQSQGCVPINNARVKSLLGVAVASLGGIKLSFGLGAGA
jgi:hypothetical protein